MNFAWDLVPEIWDFESADSLASPGLVLTMGARWAQNGDMNNRAGIGAVLVAWLTWFAATGFAQTGGKVEIKDDYIVVHPGANISKADAQALDAVLGRYDKSLYKIDVYKNGRTKDTLGNLRDMCIDQRAVAELMQAKAQGESNRAIQLVAPGSAVNPTTSTNGSPTPGTAVNPTTSPSGSPTPGTAANPTSGSPTPPGGSVPVHPTMVPSSSPVNPTQNTPVPQVAVNPTATNQPCASTDPKASEFLQRVKPILEKYSR